jgi:hypothetical protein
VEVVAQVREEEGANCEGEKMGVAVLRGYSFFWEDDRVRRRWELSCVRVGRLVSCLASGPSGSGQARLGPSGEQRGPHAGHRHGVGCSGSRPVQ